MVNLQRLSELTKQCHQHQANLIAVSKTKPESDILEAYQAGHRLFGENRVQELAPKQQNLPNDIEWHMIGHLQRNKVKDIISFVRMIHSVDNIRLAREVNKQAGRAGRNVAVLLQIHIAEESSKFGFQIDELETLLNQDELQSLPFLQISGLMGMATFTSDMDQVRAEFKTLKQCFDRLKERYFQNETAFREISMGMSGDYEVALEEGSTLIRVGSAIFGSRNNP